MSIKPENCSDVVYSLLFNEQGKQTQECKTKGIFKFSREEINNLRNKNKEPQWVHLLGPDNADEPILYSHSNFKLLTARQVLLALPLEEQKLWKIYLRFQLVDTITSNSDWSSDEESIVLE
jgi:hypothetical protein